MRKSPPRSWPSGTQAAWASEERLPVRRESPDNLVSQTRLRRGPKMHAVGSATMGRFRLKKASNNEWTQAFDWEKHAASRCQSAAVSCNFRLQVD